MNDLKIKLKILTKNIKTREQIGLELSKNIKEKTLLYWSFEWSFMFLSDLVRALSIECEISFFN